MAPKLITRAGLKRLARDLGADLLLSATVQRSRDRIQIQQRQLHHA